MQWRAVDNPWQSEAWEALGVLGDYEGPDEPRVIVDSPAATQWLYPGHPIVLQRSEAEGYFHNVSAAAPSVFVLWRMEERVAVAPRLFVPGRMEEGVAGPPYVPVSYDEASRWMDGGAHVDAVPMPAAMR